MHQAVQVVHGALEVAQHPAHFRLAVAKVFSHHVVGFTDAVHQAMIIALQLLQRIE